MDGGHVEHGSVQTARGDVVPHALRHTDFRSSNCCHHEGLTNTTPKPFMFAHTKNNVL